MKIHGTFQFDRSGKALAFQLKKELVAKGVPARVYEQHRAATVPGKGITVVSFYLVGVKA